MLRNGMGGLTAASIVVAAETVTGSAVIHSRTRASLGWTRPAQARSRSRDVIIPVKRP